MLAKQGAKLSLAATMRINVEIEEKPTPAQRRHHRQQVQKRLHTIHKLVTQLTDRTPPVPQRIKLADNGSLDSSRFCGMYKGDTLYIAYQVVDRPLLLDAVLFREIYRGLLPASVQEVPECDDLGLLCAYQHFTDNQRKKLLQIWQAVSPRRYYGDITYHAPYSFPIFNQVTQQTFLRLILPFLDELEPASSPLSSREYVELIETFMMNYVSVLNDQELKILHLLQEEPNATIRELKQRCSLSIGSLSNYLSGLREKLLLSRFYRVNFPRIRLNHVAVLAYPAPGSRINHYLEQCPYLRKIHRFGGAHAPYLISYALPRLRLRRLREWLQELVGLGHLRRFRVYPIDGIFHGYNLRSYLAYDSSIPVSNRFRWVAWIRYLRDVLIKEGYGDVLPQPYVYTYSAPHIEAANLTNLDFQLLIHDSPEVTAEQLANRLGESVHTIRRHQRQVVEKNVIFQRPDLAMYHLGLNETLFVMLEANDVTIRNFLAGCREAPMYGGSLFSHPTSGCIVAFGLPTGLALKVGRALTHLFLEQSDFDGAVFYGSGSKDFAASSVLSRCRFDQEKNQWMWHREYFPTAFDHVDNFQSDWVEGNSERGY